MGRPQYSQVSAAAPVGHAQTGGNGGVDGIEAHQLPHHSGAQDGPHHDQECHDHIAQGNGIGQFIQVRIGPDPYHDDQHQAGAHERSQPFGRCFGFLGHHTQHGQDGDQDDHPSKGMDFHSKYRRQQGLAQQVAGSIEADSQEEGTAHFFNGGNPVFFFRIHFNARTDQTAAVTGPGWLPFPHLVQKGCRKDGENIGNGQYGNGKRVVVSRLVSSDAFINLGQRHGPGPVAAPIMGST